MQSKYQDRRGQIKEACNFLNADAFLVSSLVNVRYLSGFTGSNGLLLISGNNDFLFTDSRYIEQGREQTCDQITVSLTSGFSAIEEVSRLYSLTNVAFESDHLTYSEFTGMEKLLNPRVNLISSKGVVEKIRSVKDNDEVDLIRRAASLADDAVTLAIQESKPGKSEFEIAWVIEKFLRENGADGVAFDTIVATGANSAKPHHRAGSTIIKAGDPLVIDMGALLDGYRSDITRTILVEGEDEKFRCVYEVVLEAQITAIEAARQGVIAKDLDLVAREVIANHGFGQNFSHGLGHGVGLNVHEMPMVVPSSEHILEEGMIFTVEPGIYLPGWGGVRIEDMVLLEEAEVSLLTNAPK
ncbi:MAG: aminopeptidase P family protein [SAR202 cluster bacterium]|nr:aminopeptidase P family protein [SAR202 cluster bacterium]|tara:strand:- start:6729 stop:7793 length:1065 start_codon:yes stop_codon:yes gene_type:complete